jgi:hypothetical protein
MAPDRVHLDASHDNGKELRSRNPTKPQTECEAKGIDMLTGRGARPGELTRRRYEQQLEERLRQELTQLAVIDRRQITNGCVMRTGAAKSSQAISS